MENLSRQQARDIKDELVDREDPAVAGLLGRIGLFRIARNPDVWGFDIALQNMEDQDAVLDAIPEQYRENVRFSAAVQPEAQTE